MSLRAAQLVEEERIDRNCRPIIITIIIYFVKIQQLSTIFNIIVLLKTK